MPPSKRSSQRTRRARDPSPSPVPTVAAAEQSSPSRPAKRRKKLQEPSSEPVEDEESSILTVDQSANPTNSSDEGSLLTQVVQRLHTIPVQASTDHANAIHEAKTEDIEAYAKLAAQDWTYYITTLSINIGRNSEPHTTTYDPEHKDFVHIDLGPSKIFSRQTAIIYFDSESGRWFLQVKGRNGLKVDNAALKREDSPHPLASGEVIEAGGIEMMFVLPENISSLRIHPMYLERAGLKPQRSSPAPYGSSSAFVPNQNDIDLSKDENKHIKPHFSYAQMITQAIMATEEHKLNLAGIYQYITNNYAYYRYQPAAGWQNSIRHNLSLNKSFTKAPRSTDEPGKGMKWEIVPEAKEDMFRVAYKGGRGGHRGSSAPSSPSQPNQLNYITQGPKDMAARDGGSARRRRVSPTGPGSFQDGSPLPRPRKGLNGSGSFGTSDGTPRSPPTLSSSYAQDEGASFVTPAPHKVHPRLAPPSTAQRPSQHMPTSSPAPFWKYADINSTPFKPDHFDMSPSKPLALGLPNSSSPPGVAVDRSPVASPTRSGRGQTQETATIIAEEEEEEGGFDLTKGFQSISSYHAPIAMGGLVPRAGK
ncbi:putative fork head domain-containing protein [Eutypa lata UCREL1]|uniref:Putative fork head domain-containing protein n=1 Tax=Eutypa lata (strain UCR-EL1) TaxID=1287681 RepID=M7TTQ9_EUTLA|nr:putative fork head domain-containing protein [Eutypa lata UCREL1]